MRRRKAALLAALLLTGGCYHAIIDTGRPPSPVKIEKPWALSFIYGLVPPAPVDTKATCPNGVSKVETQLSFLNGLVAGITFSILTPMTITVTCAQ